VSTPLKVLLVTTSLMRGGAETQVFLLARTLAARGHTVEVVTLRDPEAYGPELAALGIPLVSLGMRRGVPDPRALFALARVVRRMRPDVVHAHMVHANLLARSARPLAWAPVLVSTAHNLVEGGRGLELAYRLTDPLGTLTTNVAQAAVDRYVRVGAAPAARIRRMPNGLDLAAFAPDPGRRTATRAALGADERFAWLTVGRLDVQKDYPTLLRAFAALPGDDVVWLVGEGPDRASLEAAAVAADVGDRVRFLGARSDVADLMAAADAFVLSSAWEGLPLVLLEAAAAELPAVVTDVGGNAEVVRHEETGLIVPARDPGALAAAMGRLRARPASERRAWGAAARAHVAASFDLQHVVDAWESLYRALLAPRRRASAHREPGGPA
jgi:glycosyltransferase involved in cell wall biosynthesis